VLYAVNICDEELVSLDCCCVWRAVVAGGVVVVVEGTEERGEEKKELDLNSTSSSV
jgi:hypothetical protein